ncbi:MAG: hypothetical protein KF893_01680 [Caldilineaceae bacterium]|nr:hypothetical protein [Caldilineaceae bacterium]
MISALRRLIAAQPGVFTGLVFVLAFPSFEQVQKYTGNGGVLVYLILVMGVVALFLFAYDKIIHLVPERHFWWLAAVTIAVVLLLFVVVYPIANVQTPGKGSDGDDSIHLATLAFLTGQSPYGQLTYLGNPIIVLPGGILLAIPFTLVGHTALQNVFWLALFLLIMRTYLKDGRAALLAVWSALILAPVLMYTVVVGTDQVANSIYVLLAVIGLVAVAQQPKRTMMAVLAMSFVLGVALSSRSNFLLLTPVVFSALLYSCGWRVATLAMGVTIVTFMGLALPFYLHDPQNFTPFHTASKLTRLNRFLPHAAEWIVGLNLLVAILLAFRKENAHMPQLLAHCTWVLAVPVVMGVALPSLYQQRLSLGYAGYGIFFLFFGLAASWGMFMNRTGATKTFPTSYHERQKTV